MTFRRFLLNTSARGLLWPMSPREYHDVSMKLKVMLLTWDAVHGR